MLDSANMEIKLPQDNLLRIKASLTLCIAKKMATNLSLVGLLQHATKVIQCGHTFVARMYATAAKVK